MNGESIKILLIEDHRGDARVIERLLTDARASFELVVSDRLASGLEHLAADKPDVILLDVLLPDSMGA